MHPATGSNVSTIAREGTLMMQQEVAQPCQLAVNSCAAVGIRRSLVPWARRDGTVRRRLAEILVRVPLVRV